MSKARNEDSPSVLTGPTLSRRTLLQAGPVAVLGGHIASGEMPSRSAGIGALARPDRARPVGTTTLVVVTLDGGNDGLNTVIPYTDPVYLSRRGPLAYAPDRVLALDGDFGLHPSLARGKALWDAGHLAVVHGVGLPNAHRSHFRSMDVWDTAIPDGFAATGWLGRWADHAGLGESAVAATGTSVPKVIVGRRTSGALLPNRTDGASGVAGELEAQLDSVVAQVESGAPTRAFAVRVAGFDTHVNQRDTHAKLLAILDRAIIRFLDEMESSGRAVTVVVHSEFGRRIEPNESFGTDHGGAAPVLVFGPRVRGGHYGDAPNLQDLHEGDLKVTTDFRRVYATLLERVLHADARAVLGGTFEPLGYV